MSTLHNHLKLSIENSHYKNNYSSQIIYIYLLLTHITQIEDLSKNLHLLIPRKKVFKTSTMSIVDLFINQSTKTQPSATLM